MRLIDSFRYPGRGGELADVQPLGADCVSRAAVEAKGDAVARAVTMLLDQLIRVHDGQLAIPGTSVAAAWYHETGIDPARHGVWRAQRVFGAATLLSRDDCPGRAVQPLHERTAATLDDTGRSLLRSAQAARFGAWAVSELDGTWEIAPIGHPFQRTAERVIGVQAAPGEDVEWARTHVVGWVLDLAEGGWLVQAFPLQRRAVAALTGAARGRPSEDASRTYLRDAMRLVIDPRYDLGAVQHAAPILPAPLRAGHPSSGTVPSSPERGRPMDAPRPPSRPTSPPPAPKLEPTAEQIRVAWEVMIELQAASYQWNSSRVAMIRSIGWQRSLALATDRCHLVWAEGLRMLAMYYPGRISSLGGRDLLRHASPHALAAVLFPRWGLDAQGQPTAAAVRDVSALPTRLLFDTLPAWIRPLGERPVAALLSPPDSPEPDPIASGSLGVRLNPRQLETLRERYATLATDVRAHWTVLCAMRVGDLAAGPAPVAVAQLLVLLRPAALQRVATTVPGWEPRDQKSASKVLDEVGLPHATLGDLYARNALAALERRAVYRRLQFLLLDLVADPENTRLGHVAVQQHVDTTLDALADLLGELGGDDSL